jgi:hypothetical protein
MLPQQTDAGGLLEFLTGEQAKAVVVGNTGLAEGCAAALKALHGLLAAGVWKAVDGEPVEATFNALMGKISEEAVGRRQRSVHNEKHKKLVTEAVKSVTNHHTYLQGKLEYYKTYLDNVRKGAAQQTTPSSKAAPVKGKAEEKKPFKKFTHEEMVSSGVLVKINMALDASKKQYLYVCLCV